MVNMARMSPTVLNKMTHIVRVNSSTHVRQAEFFTLKLTITKMMMVMMKTSTMRQL